MSETYIVLDGHEEYHRTRFPNDGWGNPIRDRSVVIVLGDDGDKKFVYYKDENGMGWNISIPAQFLRKVDTTPTPHEPTNASEGR